MRRENVDLTSQAFEHDLELLRRANGSDLDALNELFGKYRAQLRRMIALRMNPQLRSRLDASDVVQDTLVEAVRTVDQFVDNPTISVNVWLRRLANEKLIQAHRRHLGTLKRDASRDQSIHGTLSATSEAIAMQLVAQTMSPSETIEKQDRKHRLASALDRMDPMDREVLVLRHFENLNSREASEVLGLKYETAKKRYIRALEKLQLILADDEEAFEK